MFRLSVPFEVKGVDSNAIEGLGSTFGNVDLGGDVIIPGAFKRSIAAHKSKGTMPAMLWQHDSHQVPGVWTSASETDDGLLLKGEFADTQLGRETRTLGLMGAVRGLSIGGFIEEFDFDKEGHRIIKEFDLWETSVVTFPMNPEAQIAAVKSMYTPRQFEKHLRDVGCSHKAAKTLVSDLFGSSGMEESDQRDVDDDLLEAAGQLTKYREQMMAGMIRNQLRRK